MKRKSKAPEKKPQPKPKARRADYMAFCDSYGQITIFWTGPRPTTHWR